MFLDYLILMLLLRLRAYSQEKMTIDDNDDFDDEFGLYQEPKKPDLRVIH